MDTIIIVDRGWRESSANKTLVRRTGPSSSVVMIASASVGSGGEVCRISGQHDAGVDEQASPQPCGCSMEALPWL